MKKSIILGIIMAICLPKLSAQFPNPALFNTASDASGTGTLSVNSNDLNWKVSINGLAGPYVSAVSAGNPYPSGWVTSPYPNANWISYPHTCAPVPGWPNSPAEHACLNPASLDLFYRVVLDLPATNCGIAISTASAYCLSFDFYADNTVYEVLVNGNSVFLNSTSNPYYQMDFVYNANKTISLCDFWQAGSNTITVHVKSGQGSAPTWEALLVQANQTITTVGAPPNWSINTGATPATCFGLSNGSGTITTSGSQGPFTYAWAPSGGNAAVASGLAAGVYTVTASSNGCAQTGTIAVAQPSSFSVNVVPADPKCAGKTVTLSASGAVTYSWQPGNLGGTSVTVSPNVATVYTVTGFDASGCTAKKTYTQSVLICTGVNTQGTALRDLVITPNPGDGIFSISGLQSESMVEVIDLTGRQLMSSKTFSGTLEIDLSGRQAGLYFVKVSANGNYSLRKLVLR